MKNLCATLVAVLILLSAPLATAQVPQEVNSGYPNSEEGFRSQFNAILQAYCSEGKAQGSSLLDNLRLPNQANWFGQNFDPNEAAKLSERYDRIAPDEQASLEKTIEDICKAPNVTFSMHVDNTELHEPPASVHAIFTRSQVQPLHELKTVRFDFKIEVKGKYAGGWEFTLIYEDGAFRFVGGGGWPFWTWEKGPLAPPRGFFNWPLEVIHQVPADYPAAAKQNRVGGVVELMVVVDKDGMVTRTQVIKGDPLLVEAAIAAVKKWRYKPVPVGGDPIEATTIANFVFQRPD
jgi:TonB family protein